MANLDIKFSTGIPAGSFMVENPSSISSIKPQSKLLSSSALYIDQIRKQKYYLCSNFRILNLVYIICTFDQEHFLLYMYVCLPSASTVRVCLSKQGESVLLIYPDLISLNSACLNAGCNMVPDLWRVSCNKR